MGSINNLRYHGSSQAYSEKYESCTNSTENLFTQTQQKIYVNNRHKNLEFQVWDKVFFWKSYQ